MSLKIVTESLSREEMRMITGGSGAGCLDMKCGSDHPGSVCCAQTWCDSPKSGYCKPN